MTIRPMYPVAAGDEDVCAFQALREIHFQLWMRMFFERR